MKDKLIEALNLLKASEFKAAEFLLTKLIKKQPNNPDVLTLMGSLSVHNGRYYYAIDLLEKSLSIIKEQPNALLNVGIAYIETGQFDQAISYIRKSLEYNPKYAESFYHLGLIHLKIKETESAIECYEKAIEINPVYFEAIAALGYLFLDIKMLNSALELFKKAVFLSKNNPKLLGDLGEIHIDLGNFNEAIANYSLAINLDSNNPLFFNNRGVAFSKVGMTHEALSDLSKAIKLLPDYFLAFRNRCNVLIDQNKLEDAEFDCKKMIELNPNDGEPYKLLGLISFFLDDLVNSKVFYSKAVALYRKINQENPNDKIAIYNAGIFCLNQKEFSIGWDLYSSRMGIDTLESELAIKNEISKVCSEWEGQLDCESLLIICEQGVGDQILHLSMLGELSKKIKKITVMLNFKLITLLKRSFKGIHFISVKPNKFVMPTDICNFKYFIFSGDLGKFLRGSIESFRNQPSAYLKADLEKANQFRSKFKPTQLVCGLSWASQVNKGALYTEEVKSKSITLNDLLPLFNTATNLTYINLQYGDVKNEITYFKDSFGVEILDADNDNYNDLDGLASLIQSCDFVITTSNVTAHIAGALGKKTFVLVNPSMLWYWHDEDQSSWYPSVNIFQQKEYKNWSVAINSLVSRVSIYLKDFKHV